MREINIVCVHSLLPYDQGSNSVIQSDWLKTFECDVMIGHYYPVMPAHDVTTQLRTTTNQWFEHDQQFEQHQKASTTVASC